MSFGCMLLVVQAKTNDFFGVKDGRTQPYTGKHSYLLWRCLFCHQLASGSVELTTPISIKGEELARGGPACLGIYRNEARCLSRSVCINYHAFEENTRPKSTITLIGNQLHTHLLNEEAKKNLFTLRVICIQKTAREQEKCIKYMYHLRNRRVFLHLCKESIQSRHIKCQYLYAGPHTNN